MEEIVEIVLSLIHSANMRRSYKSYLFHIISDTKQKMKNTTITQEMWGHVLRQRDANGIQ